MEVLEQFKDSWSKFDPDATGYIRIIDFANLMFELGPPLGWDRSYENNRVK
jgi:Ca2+-binding EF-hand superfamily protein